MKIALLMLLVPALVMGADNKLIEARLNGSNKAFKKCLDPVEVGFRRKAFEDASLNYVEEVLSSFEDKFETGIAFQRCMYLMELEFVEYPYRADALHARVLLVDFGAGKDEKLFKLLHKIIKDGRRYKDKRELNALIDGVVSHKITCEKLGKGDVNTLNRLDKYVSELNKVIAGEEGEWVTPNR